MRFRSNQEGAEHRLRDLENTIQWRRPIQQPLLPVRVWRRTMDRGSAIVHFRGRPGHTRVCIEIGCFAY